MRVSLCACMFKLSSILMLTWACGVSHCVPENNGNSSGFEVGAEITAGSKSALPGRAGDLQLRPITSIACVGDEATLGECDISSGFFPDYGDTDGNTVAVLCSAPPGACTPRLQQLATTVTARLNWHG